VLRVLEDTVLALQKDEVTEVWRRLHNMALRNFYASPDLIRVIISKRGRLMRHVGRGGEVLIHSFSLIS
jgi:hypothetical protein